METSYVVVDDAKISSHCDGSENDPNRKKMPHHAVTQTNSLLHAIEWGNASSHTCDRYSPGMTTPDEHFMRRLKAHYDRLPMHLVPIVGYFPTLSVCIKAFKGKCHGPAALQSCVDILTGQGYPGSRSLSPTQDAIAEYLEELNIAANAGGKHVDADILRFIRGYRIDDGTQKILFACLDNPYNCQPYWATTAIEHFRFMCSEPSEDADMSGIFKLLLMKVMNLGDFSLAWNAMDPSITPWWDLSIESRRMLFGLTQKSAMKAVVKFNESYKSRADKDVDEEFQMAVREMGRPN